MSTDPREPAGQAQDPHPNDAPSNRSEEAPRVQDTGPNERTETLPPTPPPANYPMVAPQVREPRKRRSGLIAGIAIAVAVLVGAGGGIAIYAASTSHHQNNSRQSMQGNRERPGFGSGQSGQRALPGIPNGLATGQTLHGDFVVPGDQGNYVTRRQQNGNVTEISATSITVASKDGYTQTYAINDSTRKSGDLKTGDTVTVLATVSGNTATANTISEGNSPQRNNLPPRN